MSLPTGGMPTSNQSAMPNVFSQQSQVQNMPLSLMGMSNMPGLGRHAGQFVIGSQAGMIRLPPGVMGAAAEAMVNTASASQLGSLGSLSNDPIAISLATGGRLNENGHSSISPLHQIPDSSSGAAGGVNLPYGNITVKQEMGLPGPGMPGGSRSTMPPVQFPQLSSTENAPCMPSNPFSVTNNTPLSKHICAVCGDRASGKHYGVYSCEGCKGFFKRTVRKYLTYTCRDDKECVIDKRQRNRCQYCRYQKCLAMGMKKEAVQEERQRNKDQEEAPGEQLNPADDMPVDKILQAEIASDPKMEDIMNFQSELMDSDANVCKAADHQLFTLVGWAKRVPHFSTLPLDDQVTLLRAGWNELLIAAFSHRSIEIPDGIILASGLRVYRQSAHSAGVGAIFDRVLTELIAKMRDMQMDRTELGCLRAIVLFNPDAKDLSDSPYIESLREKVYASLEVYCKSKYPDQPGRFAKLLLRLPALRSIGLKCLEHLFFFKLIGNTPIDQFLMEKLSSDKDTTTSASSYDNVSQQVSLSTATEYPPVGMGPL
ncbi:unnamed protein product [Clavelina lepadiformis]|uniref:Retinoid X receptor n=1 Tax=Clavelina lepadiformis TaxID=159417 RepID=A0ABP0FAF1_CLALP